MLKLTFSVFACALLALPINVSATPSKTALNDALELALQSPGKVIDLAPYRDKSSAVAKMGEVSAKTRLKVDQSFGRMPLLFEKNEGQTSDDVKFLSRGRGYNFYLTATESVMVLSKAVEENKSGKTVSEKTDSENASGKLDPLNRLASLENPPKIQRAVLRMQVVGANEKAIIKGEEKLTSTSNYFLGNDQSKWRQGVENFARVHYEDIYPGIDLVYYGNQNKLEYDFIVKPGANPNKIELNFSGADNISLDDQGNLVLRTNVGDVIQHKPVLDSNSKCNFYRLGKWISCGNIVVFPTDQSERCTDERLHATYPRTTIPDSCLFESWFHAKRDRHRNRLPSFHHQS